MKPARVERPRKSARAASRFFIRVGQAQTSAKVYDEYSRPLFPLALILDCEGMLRTRKKTSAGGALA